MSYTLDELEELLVKGCRVDESTPEGETALKRRSCDRDSLYALNYQVRSLMQAVWLEARQMDIPSIEKCPWRIYLKGSDTYTDNRKQDLWLDAKGDIVDEGGELIFGYRLYGDDGQLWQQRMLIELDTRLNRIKREIQRVKLKRDLKEIRTETRRFLKVLRGRLVRRT